MKKIFSCMLAMVLGFAVNVFAINPYAVNVAAEQDGSNVNVSYFLNADADAAEVQFIANNEVKATVALTDLTAGAHQAVVAIPETLAKNVHYSLAVAVADSAHGLEVYRDAALTVDNRMHGTVNPFLGTPGFGEIYLAARTASAGAGRCYYKASADYVVNTTAWNPYTTSSVGRPAVAPNGLVFLAEYGDAASGIWVYNMETDTAIQFFQGTKNSKGLYVNPDNNDEVGGSTPGIAIYGEGANAKLYAVIEDFDAKDSSPFHLAIYNIGQPDGSLAESWATAPSTRIQMSHCAGGNMAVAPNQYGAWVGQNRSLNQNNSDARSLQFYTNDGVCKFTSDNTEIFNGSPGGGVLTDEANNKLYFGNGNGDLMQFSITWAADTTPTLTLDTIYALATKSIGQMTFDYAHNIVATAGTGGYAVGGANMSLTVLSLPTADMAVVTTPIVGADIFVEGSNTPAAGVVYAYANAGQVEQQNVEIPCQGGKILFGAATSKWEKKPISGFDTDSIMAYKLDGDAKTDGTNSKYVRCLLNSPLHAGDKIVISGFCGSKPGANIGFFATIDRAASDTIGYVSHTAAQNTFGSDTLVVPAEYEGLYDFFITRGNGKSIYFYGVQVLSDVAPLTGRRIGANEVIYLHAAHVNWWQNDNAVQTAWFISAAGDTTTITGVEHANAEYVGFTMPATGTFATVKFGRGNESTIWNTTGDIALEGTTENCVMEFANNSAEAVWGHFDDSAPVQVTYKIKHPWGGGSWTWKDLTEDTDGTWYIADIYGGAGCNVDPKVLGKDWISSPTLVNEPASGDSCLFVVNPLATTEAEIITITKLGSTDTVPVPPTPVDTLRLYEIGNNQGWDPTAAIEMTATADSIFEGDFAFTADTTWFAFITVKPETADWNLVNANRYGGANNNELVLNGTYNLAKGEYGFKANSGEYHIVVNIPAMTMTIQKKTSEGLNDMKADDQVMKIYENGQIYIIRNGVRYTAAGAKVE